MRAYLVTTGAVFGLLVVVHVWRVVEEGPRVAGEPWLVGSTLVAAAMSLWAFRLLRRLPRS